MLTTTARNSMLDDFAELAELASLHTADPGDSGGHEVRTIRQAVRWSPASYGAVRSASETRFEVPAGVTLTHVGYWSAAGQFVGARELDEPQEYRTKGVYIVSPGAL